MCRPTYLSPRAFVNFCSPDCGEILAGKKLAKMRAQKERMQRRIDAEKREELKPRSEFIKEAQSSFNKFIRVRDAAQPCISCQRHHDGQYHAGHYLTTGARPELRFCEENVHKQCAPCNNHLSGNLVLYRKNLILKIGQDKVDWLEGFHEAKHYTIEDLKAIKAKYTAMARELERGIA